MYRGARNPTTPPVRRLVGVCVRRRVCLPVPRLVGRCVWRLVVPPVRRLAGLSPGAVLAACALCIAGSGATELEAQVVPREGPLPREVEAGIIELANAPGTLRITGGGRVPAGTAVSGDVVVLGGGLQLGGAITGDLVVVNGDLVVEEAASVEGSTLVVGGEVRGADPGWPGVIEVYQAPLRYRVRAGRVEGIAGDGAVTSRFLATDLGFGRTRLAVRAAGAYNRSEGLPVQFGPVFEASGRNPLVLEAFGIWRSVSGLHLDTERLGYEFTLDQGLGGRGTMSVGTGAYSVVRPIEARGLHDLESALSTFFLNRDLRDHYEARGWHGYFELRPVRTPVRFRLTYREEEHASVAVEDPWTLGRGNEPWRPQPRVGVGTARFLEAEAEWDSRDDPTHPSDGWWLRLRGTHQTGGDLRAPSHPDPSTEVSYAPVRWGSLDFRRYARVSPSSRLQVRAYLSGSPGTNPLPPQFQSALGGEGSLPGHPHFSLSCDARRELVPPEESGSADGLVGYGCDGVSLAQIEFQKLLPFVWNPLPDDLEGSEWGSLVRVQPIISAFLNAGEGWTRNRAGLPARTGSPARADIGLGLVTGSLGLYWAYPLNRKERGLNFFVRLDHRF